MGSLILCHKKKAAQPYEITRIHRRIYTLEELCYYICNNLYLIDYTVMNEQLCDWIQDELELTDMAHTLKSAVKRHGAVEQFVLTILQHSGMYTKAEILHMQNVLEKLKNQNEIERRKYMGDNLLRSGEVREAILVYQSIIYGERDESVGGRFYGKVYACLGSAYGKLFLYEEAARMYECAFQICEEESMLTAYIYCCKKYMTPDDYRRLIGKSTVYIGIDRDIEDVIQEKAEEVEVQASRELLEKWQQKYRKNI